MYFDGFVSLPRSFSSRWLASRRKSTGKKHPRRERLLLGSVIVGAFVAVVSVIGAVATTASAATAIPTRTRGDARADITSGPNGLVIAAHGIGGSLSMLYTTECGDLGSCLRVSMVNGAGVAALTPGPCNQTPGPGFAECPLSVLGDTIVMTSDGIGNALTIAKSPDCAPASYVVRGGPGPDSITLEGGCYAVVSCGAGYGEDDQPGPDNVNDNTGINPSIDGDCDMVVAGGKIIRMPGAATATPAGKSPTGKKPTSTKKPATTKPASTKPKK